MTLTNNKKSVRNGKMRGLSLIPCHTTTLRSRALLKAGLGPEHKPISHLLDDSWRY